MTPPFCRLLTGFLPLLLVVPASSLMCHSCQSTTPFSECESNVRELHKGVRSKFAVNCSDYSHLSQTYCAIEYYMQHGSVNAMIRDCNDGTFSFIMNNYPYFKMKRVNGRSNVTVCAYSSGVVECVSLCDTDMCNGPSTAARLHGRAYRTAMSLLCLIGLALLI